MLFNARWNHYAERYGLMALPFLGRIIDFMFQIISEPFNDFFEELHEISYLAERIHLIMYYNPDIFKIQSNNLVPRKGRVLIAEPFLPGNYFNRSVILLVAYSKKGTVGFILNKQVELTVQDYIIDFPDFNAPVYIGGPVSTDTIYFIHTRGDVIPGSIPVLDNIFWGGDFDELKRLADMGVILPSEVRFFLGYSGWDAGQLEHEIKEDSWLVNDVDGSTVMRRLGMSSWADFVRKVGEKYSIWTNFPENPVMN